MAEAKPCWCNGVGGRYRRSDEIGRPAGFGHYCDCEAGSRAKEEAERNAPLARLERVRVFKSEANVPKHLQVGDLSSSPHQAAAGMLLGMDGCQSAYVWGPYGRGKSTLAASYLLDWIDKHCRRGAFIGMPKLLGRLRATYDGQGSEMGVIDYFSTVPLLVLDDIGAEQVSGTGWVEDRTLWILEERLSETRPTIFTSNLGLRQMSQHIGERVVQRIVEMCGPDRVIELTGQNFRISPAGVRGEGSRGALQTAEPTRQGVLIQPGGLGKPLERGVQ